jgi:putative membrane protein
MGFPKRPGISLSWYLQQRTIPPGAAAEQIRRPAFAIGALSAAIASFLIWLIYFKGKVVAPGWIGALPTANATFNSLSALCLVCGYINIRRKNRAVHMRFMLSATFFSALFLISYITYHYFHGDTKFPGQGWIRPVYFLILISHIGLSMIALPLILATLWFASRKKFHIHRRIARWAFPVWLYVSVTGVVVYLVLRSYTG